MKKPKIKKPGGAEMEVLKILWGNGPSSAREIEAAMRRKGRRWAVTTIHTLLARLKQKALVKDAKSEGILIFEAAVDKSEIARHEFRQMAAELGSGISIPIVRALVERGKLSAEEIAELRQIIDNLEEG